MFEILSDTDGMYRFRLLGEQGAVVAVSQGYEGKSEVVAAIRNARELAATALIRDRSATAAAAR